MDQMPLQHLGESLTLLRYDANVTHSSELSVLVR